MTDPLEIRLLGPFEVLVNGHAADVGGSKRQGLLAVLALRRGHVVAVDALIEALWEEELPATPRNAVQHHVARLRAALGQEAIVASSDGYGLGEAVVDALRFEELLAETRALQREADATAAAESIAFALGLWRGSALHGLTDTAWFVAEARRLEALRVDALEEQFEAALALGEHREVASALRATLEENPFRERLWGQLMLALYRSGRQADALETFQEARRVLSDELGLDPGPELQQLQAAILAQDPAVAPPTRRRLSGNLPAQTTSFVGREQDLERVAELLRDNRLVTLTGPPGVGKSRLALEAARSLESENPDGVWMVDLSRAADSRDVARVVALAVDARGPDSLARVVARLRDADALLVLDACEHVLPEAVRVVSEVLAECPSVRVLATSREVLRVPAESRLQVEPLPLPDPSSPDILDAPAVQLFLARARAARPGFELSPETAPIAAEIARELDGLPLGIELAAARTNVFGLPELRSVVERRLALLEDRPQSNPARTALRSLVEWSYDLLHADEKVLLHQIAVHRGGASLASLVATAADQLDEPTVTYLLGALVDKSIVSVSFPAEGPRYDLLDTVRDYALERLSESGRIAEARRAHAGYFAGLAESARSELQGPDWLPWTVRLTAENENFWAALRHAADAAEGDLALRLGGSLGWYFVLCERISEGRRYLELARSAAGEGGGLDLRADLLAFLSYLAAEELDIAAAVEIGEQGVALPTTPGSREWAIVRIPLALALAVQGALEQAAELADEARIAASSIGDHWLISAAGLIRAQAAARTGDVSTVADLVPQVVEHSDAIRFDAFAAPAALLDGWAAERRGQADAAAAAYRRAVELADRVGFSDHAAFALVELGSNALARGDLVEAEELERRALELAEESDASWTAAHARVALARVLLAGGDAVGAESLYAAVVDWSGRSRPHRGRESLFLALTGSPATAALLGLADQAEARGDAATAETLRTRAQLIVV
jgi:predicted ATPase/DNA-binding SARP family transcriptional activator